MTTEAKSNYGTLLKFNGSSLGEVIVLEPPELSNPAVEATSQNSGGYREYVTGALVEVGEFKATINVASPTSQVPASGVTGWVLDGQPRAFEIAFSDVDTLTWSFSALVTSVKPGTVDDQKPEVVKYEITFRPTGQPTLST